MTEAKIAKSKMTESKTIKSKMAESKTTNTKAAKLKTGEPKIALVCDWLTVVGGAEQVPFIPLNIARNRLTGFSMPRLKPVG